MFSFCLLVSFLNAIINIIFIYIIHQIIIVITFYKGQSLSVAPEQSSEADYLTEITILSIVVADGDIVDIQKASLSPKLNNLLPTIESDAPIPALSARA